MQTLRQFRYLEVDVCDTLHVVNHGLQETDAFSQVMLQVGVFTDPHEIV